MGGRCFLMAARLPGGCNALSRCKRATPAAALPRLARAGVGLLHVQEPAGHKARPLLPAARGDTAKGIVERANSAETTATSKLTDGVDELRRLSRHHKARRRGVGRGWGELRWPPSAAGGELRRTVVKDLHRSEGI